MSVKCRAGKRNSLDYVPIEREKRGNWSESVFSVFRDRCVAGSQNKKYQPGGIDCGCGSRDGCLCAGRPWP